MLSAGHWAVSKLARTTFKGFKTTTLTSYTLPPLHAVSWTFHGRAVYARVAFGAPALAYHEVA